MVVETLNEKKSTMISQNHRFGWSAPTLSPRSIYVEIPITELAIKLAN